MEHAVLKHWITQYKLAEKALEQARADGQKWFKRAKLAKEQGRLELVEPAKQQALEARERYEKAAIRLAEADIQRRAALEEAKSARAQATFNQAQQRAEQTAASFSELGIDPAFAGLEAEAERTLDSDSSPEPELDDDDALRRLRGNVQAAPGTDDSV